MTLHGEVLDRLRAWLPSNEEQERPQIQLATVDDDARPDVRTVLLSEWDVDGFVFHTDSASRKVGQLAAHPAVALLLLWPRFSRQLVVRGIAEPADAVRLQRAFDRRSPYLKQLSWLNSTALAQAEREERVAAWRRFTAERDPATLTAPPTWTGYLIRPDRVTFWASDPDGPSHRIEYRADGDGSWRRHHLAG